MKTIGIIIGRIGGVDGVALETEKWIDVLLRMGHRVRVLTGLLEAPRDDTDVLPALSFDDPRVPDLQGMAFFGRPADEAALSRRLDSEAEDIAQGIEAWIGEHGVDVLVSENANAIPMHLTMGMAIHRVWERTGIAGLSHDHDFAWERGERYHSPHECVRDVIATCFPSALPHVRHAVINKAARSSLKDRLGCDATVVPNVMDFDAPFAVPDEVNAGLPAALGLAASDLPLFQITRIVRRKGIETAIDLVHRLEDLPVKLVITGTAHDESQDPYVRELQDQVTRLGLGDRVLFAGDQFDNERRTREDGTVVYSLSDGYVHAKACTYFSTYEGFGNAFVEAVVARRPIFVNDYVPVYWPDIGSLGFETVMIRNGELTDEAVQEIRGVLLDPDRAKAMADANFELGRRHFSYQNLEEILRGVLDD